MVVVLITARYPPLVCLAAVVEGRFAHWCCGGMNFSTFSSCVIYLMRSSLDDGFRCALQSHNDLDLRSGIIYLAFMVYCIHGFSSI